MTAGSCTRSGAAMAGTNIPMGWLACCAMALPALFLRLIYLTGRITQKDIPLACLLAKCLQPMGLCQVNDAETPLCVLSRFIYLKIERWRDTDLSSIHRFTPRIPARARAGQGRPLEPRPPLCSVLPHKWQDPEHWAVFRCFARHINGVWTGSDSAGTWTAFVGIDFTCQAPMWSLCSYLLCMKWLFYYRNIH